ncbi:hypothetical protein [Halostagnicola sp. A-GB9-2]|nr:hypothetical protein [Halostagnicola sp. A-GB9-2]MDJ1432428.1 hypothetical protein [Halostagnicola sp. A-GB9-2]
MDISVAVRADRLLRVVIGGSLEGFLERAALEAHSVPVFTASR